MPVLIICAAFILLLAFLLLLKMTLIIAYDGEVGLWVKLLFIKIRLVLFAVKALEYLCKGAPEYVFI